MSDVLDGGLDIILINSAGSRIDTNMTDHFLTVIPARYGSTRLPGKPLLDIGGKPMIEHVYRRAVEAGSGEVIVATDDERIVDAVQSFGGRAMMTSANHHSGADRLAEVVASLGLNDSAIVVNLQGDEPMMDPALIRQAAQDLVAHPEAGLTTFATPIRQRADIFNPNIVKVVIDHSGRALYFSRAPIPWVRSDFDDNRATALPEEIVPYRHLGMYAYRVGALKTMTGKRPCAIEKAESLEQLRALWHGIQIHVAIVEDAPAHGVDTMDDLERVRSAFNALVRVG